MRVNGPAHTIRLPPEPHAIPAHPVLVGRCPAGEHAIQATTRARGVTPAGDARNSGHNWCSWGD
jgi:hypothetical protein